MKNYIGSGVLLDHLAAAAISAGDVVVMGTLLAVAADDIANGETGTVSFGVFDLPKVDAAVITAGETLTWDVSEGAFDDDQATPATGDLTGACAVAVESKGATSSGTIRVLLTGVPGTVN